MIVSQEEKIKSAISEYVAKGDVTYSQKCINGLSDFISDAIQPLTPRVSIDLVDGSELDKKNRLLRLTVTVE